MAAGSQLFFRVSIEGWIALTSVVGIDWQTFTGPLVSSLGFGQYLVPIGVLQLYFWSRERPEPVSQSTVALTIVALTLLMGAGIAATTKGACLSGI